jgi:hypothetical protein
MDSSKLRRSDRAGTAHARYGLDTSPSQTRIASVPPLVTLPKWSQYSVMTSSASPERHHLPPDLNGLGTHGPGLRSAIEGMALSIRVSGLSLGPWLLNRASRVPTTPISAPSIHRHSPPRHAPARRFARVSHSHLSRDFAHCLNFG